MIKIVKKPKKVMAVSALLILILIVTCFLTACQPTPVQEAIAQKGNDNLEEGIKQTASPTNKTGQMNDEEKWEYQREYESGHRLTVDAVIMNKNMTGIPVVSVKEKPFEGGEQIKNIVKVFCPDAKVYDRVGVTKSQIEEEIIMYEKQLYRLENGLDDGEQIGIEIAGGYDPNKSLVEQIKATIDKLKEDYNTAPDDSNLKDATYQFTIKGGSHQSNMNAVTNGHVTSADFVNWSSDDSIYLGSTFLMKDSEYLSSGDGIKILDNFVTPISLSEDDAFTKEKETIDHYVREMGINYMSLQSVCRSDIGYDYYYTRTMNGFPETYANTFLGTQTIDSDGVIVTNLWKPEYLHIETQNEKVVSVTWNNPSEVTNIDNENVQVLPWERIQEIFLKQMDYLLSLEPLSNTNETNAIVFPKETEIVVTRIELGLTKILMKDNINDYKLIPTWSFMGYDKNLVQEGVNTNAEICFVTINAIDGTIIDRGLMY